MSHVFGRKQEQVKTMVEAAAPPVHPAVDQALPFSEPAASTSAPALAASTVAPVALPASISPPSDVKVDKGGAPTAITQAPNPAPYGRNNYGEPFPSQEAADAYAQALMVRAANLAKAQADPGGVATGYVPTWLDMAKFQDTYLSGKGAQDPYQLELLKKVGTQAALNYWIVKFEYSPTTFAGYDPAHPNWEGTLKR